MTDQEGLHDGPRPANAQALEEWLNRLEGLNRRYLTKDQRSKLLEPLDGEELEYEEGVEFHDEVEGVVLYRCHRCSFMIDCRLLSKFCPRNRVCNRLVQQRCCNDTNLHLVKVSCPSTYSVDRNECPTILVYTIYLAQTTCAT